jgi:hypothetical protein
LDLGVEPGLAGTNFDRFWGCVNAALPALDELEVLDGVGEVCVACS